MHDVDHGVALCSLTFVHTMVVMELFSPHSNITTLLLCACVNGFSYGVVLLFGVVGTSPWLFLYMEQKVTTCPIICPITCLNAI